VWGSRENNIAFKCTRKRLAFETHHLDIEGGVGERRTRGTEKGEGEKAARRRSKGKDSSAGVAWIEVGIEGERTVEAAASAEKKLTGSLAKKKRVTFRPGLI
jgi:elongator complex protein 4